MKNVANQNRAKRFIYLLSAKLTIIGGFALFSMVVVTCIDVIGTKIFKRPFSGSYELVFLAQLVAIALSSGDTLIYGRHVHVEIFVLKMPTRIRKVITLIVSFLGFILFFVLAWQGFLYTKSLKSAHEVTGTVKIPLYPFALILGVSGGMVALIYLIKIFDLMNIGKDEKI